MRYKHVGHLAGYKRVTYIWQVLNVTDTQLYIYIDMDITSNGDILKVKSKHMSMMPSKLK